MKNKKFSLLVGFLLVVVMAVGCKDDVTKPKEENHLLVGTKWRLVAFVDFGIERLPDYAHVVDDDRRYLLSFDNDNTLSGSSLMNSLVGRYSVDYNTNKLSMTAGGTEMNEFGDGKLYRECLNEVQSFSFTDEELKLFYNNKENYLLFIRRQ